MHRASMRDSSLFPHPENDYEPECGWFLDNISAFTQRGGPDDSFVVEDD